MALFLVAAPTTEPVSLIDAKVHLRVDTATDDGLILALIKVARDMVETFTRRALVTQTWDWKLDAFQSAPLWLPKPPVASITSITYLDSAGASQTWSSSLYRTDLPTDPHGPRARITPAYGEAYPSTYPVTNAVTVRFVCGTAVAAVPASLSAAMKLLVGHFYEHREAVTPSAFVDLPLGVQALLWPYVVD